MSRGRIPATTALLVFAGLLALPSAILPPWSTLTRVSGCLCILSGAVFLFSVRSFTRELSISRRLGLLLALSGVAWGAVVLVASGTIGSSGVEGDRLRLLRSLNREAVAEAAMKNAQSVRGMVSLELPGPGGAVLNSLGDATGATLGVIIGTVSGASTVESDRVEPLSNDTLRGAGRFSSIGMLVSLGALLTMLALLEGLVMVDRTGPTHAIYWIGVAAVFIHSAMMSVGGAQRSL